MRYAKNTKVAVGRSRQQIDTILRQWGASGISWTDDFAVGRCCLRFIWRYQGTDYMARFVINYPDAKKIDELAVDGRTGLPSERKRAKLLSSLGCQENRILLLWLKAALNAVSAGIVTAETLFLPFLEGTDGKTVAEIAIPNLKKLSGGSAKLLLKEVT